MKENIFRNKKEHVTRNDLLLVDDTTLVVEPPLQLQRSVAAFGEAHERRKLKVTIKKVQTDDG